MKYIFIVYLFDVLDDNILLYNVHQMISFSELTQPTEKSGGESPSKFVSLSRWVYLAWHWRVPDSRRRHGSALDVPSHSPVSPHPPGSGQASGGRSPSPLAAWGQLCGLVLVKCGGRLHGEPQGGMAGSAGKTPTVFHFPLSMHLINVRRARKKMKYKKKF